MPGKKQNPPKTSESRLQYARTYYQDNKVRQSELSKKWREDHPGYAGQVAQDWRESNKEYVKDWARKKRAGLIGPFGPADGDDWKERNREVHLQNKRESTNRRRKEVVLEALRHYSGGEPKCYCCGEDTPLLLSLDHTYGGGTKHRKESKISHASHWAKRNDWPPIFRVACHSCNLGAHLNGGVCPHQSSRPKLSQVG